MKGTIPYRRKGYRSEGEKNTLRIMERKRVAILGILVLFVLSILLMALWLAGNLAQGGEVPGVQVTPGSVPTTQVTRGTSVESISDLGMFTIDPAFIQATPHWIIIVAGRKEQEAMIRYIQNTSATGEKKAAWMATLQEIWTAYPVKAVPSAGSVLITCDCDFSTMSLTGSQNATLREIEMEIALDMQKSLQTPTPTPVAG
jgi:hypothetical protein